MADIATALREEITRLARKEVRLQLEPFKTVAAHSKKKIASLRAEVSTLQRQLKQAAKQPLEAKRSSVEEEKRGTRQRFTAKGFQALRIRLGLSYEEMGKLVGASDQSIRRWEDGSSTPR